MRKQGGRLVSKSRLDDTPAHAMTVQEFCKSAKWRKECEGGFDRLPKGSPIPDEAVEFVADTPSVARDEMTDQPLLKSGSARVRGMVERRLDALENVVRELGGVVQVARITRRKPRAVCNWRRKGTFPSALYFVMVDELLDRGFYAPHLLWSFEPVREE